MRPPVINDPKALQDKFDLCNVLSDIEAAQVMADTAAMAQQQVWGLWEQQVWGLLGPKGGVCTVTKLLRLQCCVN